MPEEPCFEKVLDRIILYAQLATPLQQEITSLTACSSQMSQIHRTQLQQSSGFARAANCSHPKNKKGRGRNCRAEQRPQPEVLGWQALM